MTSGVEQRSTLIMAGYSRDNEVEVVLWNIKTKNNYDHHCWQQNKTMLLHDDVIIKLVLVIQSQKNYPESTPICHLPLASITVHVQTA